MQDRIVFQNKSWWKTREIEPSEVPYEVFIFIENLQILASAHAPPVAEREKKHQTAKYCSDIVWTQKFGFLNQV